MKKVAILGGSFDPIHIGHIMMVYYTSKLNIFDEVWIMPCYKSAWGKELTDHKHRLKMCQLAMKYINLITKGNIIRVSDYEIKNKITGRTHIILDNLKKKYNDITFSLVIGQDNADNINKWHNYKEIIKQYQFVVLPRDNKKPEKWYLKKPHIYIKDLLPNISSTEIRKGLDDNFSKYTRYIPQDVWKYILDENIYQK